jgi:ATP-dependent Clp protease ATP-binding subunit ClpX
MLEKLKTSEDESLKRQSLLNDKEQTITSLISEMEVKLKEKENKTDLYKEVTTKDLIGYGLIPEFVGRFGISTNVEELSADQLVQILKEPKNSLIKQYQYIFELDGVELQIEDEALHSIAKKAKDMETNARGLKNILEKILLQYQFEAMDLVERGLTKVVISKDTVEGKPAVLIFDRKENEKTK